MTEVKHTVEQLQKAGIGQYQLVGPGIYGWEKKQAMYKAEKAWTMFSTLRNKHKSIMKMPNGYVDTEGANKAAQAELDDLLLRRARGENVIMVGDAVPHIAETKPDEIDPDIMESLPETASPLEVIQYVFDNLDNREADPRKAPSRGAYYYLKQVQESKDNQAEFIKSVWSKTIPSKAQIENDSKRNDDNRSNIELLERFEAEMEGDASSEVPLLCLDLEEAPGS